MKGLILLVFSLFLNTLVFGQSAESLINDGVEKYKKEKFPEAEVNFKKGLEKNLESFEGHFNLGDAYYKQGRYDEALKSFQSAMSLAQDDRQKAGVFYNMGNSLVKSQKLDEGIKAYINSLKLNPDDTETKYNLSWALRQQQQQQQQNQDNKNQDKKDKQDKQDQQQQKQDKKEDQEQQQQQQQQEQKQDQEQQKQQPQPNQISKEEAERILEALKNNEAELQKELRKRKAKVVPKVKDW